MLKIGICATIGRWIEIRMVRETVVLLLADVDLIVI